MKVKRYFNTYNGLEPDKEGDLVKFEDHQHEVKRLIAIIRKLSYNNQKLIKVTQKEF